MSYMNDPREMAIRPESGVTLEQDNRVETMYHWGAMVVDLCDMPVSEYMKPMTVISIGGSGGTESGITPTLTEEVKIYLSIFRNGVLVSGEDVILSSDGEENSDNVWTAQWEWIGSFPNTIRVAATINTEIGSYVVSKDLTDNAEKKATATIVEAQGENLVSFKNYGVGSVETPIEEITQSSYTETIIDESTEYYYKYEVSTDETFIYLTLKLIVDGATKVNLSNMKYQDEIPFDKVSTEKEGYDFIGWFDTKGNKFTGTTMPSEDLILTAKYETKKCEVVFVFSIDGIEETISSTTVNYGSKVKSFPSTSMVGYVFKGWNPSINTVIKDNTIFIATFESKIYTVVWSGYTDGPIIEDYKYGETLIEPQAPEKEGYTFSGWNKTLPEIVTTDLKFTAKFVINKYKINYFVEIDGEKGDPVSSYTQNYNSVIYLKSVPTQKGYSFSEWEGYEDGMRVPSHDVDFVTVRTTNTYILAYYDNRKYVKEDEYLYGETIIPYTYQKEGWTVSEWENIPETMPYKNVSAYCTSEINFYTVTFVDQNGETYIVETEYGTPIKDIIPEIEGKTFEVSEEIYNSTVGAEDIVINGIVTVNNYKVSITIDGEKIDVTELPFGTNVEDYINENYPAEEGYSAIINTNYETVPDNDLLVVSVVYKVNIWTLTYLATGAPKELQGNKKVEYGTEVLPLLPETEQTGYDFLGWYVDDTEIAGGYTMPNNDIYAVGEYDVKKCVATVLDDENVIFETVYLYGTPLGELLNNETILSYVTTESANGYTVEFTMNGEIADGNYVITDDIVLNVNKTPNEYILTFKNEENVISSNIVKFGEIITYPEMSGYTEDDIEYIFAWEDKSYNGKPMPAMNLVIVGSYVEKNPPRIYFGSFKVSKSGYTADNTSQYFIINDVENIDVYNSILASDCIDDGASINVVVPIDEEMASLPLGKDFMYRDLYYRPLAYLIPKEVLEDYNITILDAANVNVFNQCITDNQTIVYNEKDCLFYVYKTDSTLIGKTVQTYPQTLILKKK